MKVFLAILMLAVVCPVLTMKADEPATPKKKTITERLDSTPDVKVVQPKALTERLKNVPPAAPTTTETPGNNGANQKNTANVNDKKQPVKKVDKNDKGNFTIEVYSDNSKQAKDQAGSRKKAVQSRFPQYPARLVFDSPFWRVRVGNFKSRSEAEAAMANIRRAFPAYSSFMRIIGH